MKITACLFDMDGVIVDTAKHHFLAWQRLADSLSIDFNEHHNEQLKGVSRVDSLEKILQWGGLVLDNQRKHELMELKNKWYLEYISGLTPDDILPGVLSFFRELKSVGIAIGLGSSSKNANLVLSCLNIESYFDAVVDGNMIHMSKPHPEVFLRGAQLLHSAPSDTIVFEDAQSGIEAAVAGGFHAVGIGSAAVLKGAHVVWPSMQSASIALLKQSFGVEEITA
jgi:beta-phosphoglucomutase